VLIQQQPLLAIHSLMQPLVIPAAQQQQQQQPQQQLLPIQQAIIPRKVLTAIQTTMQQQFTVQQIQYQIHQRQKTLHLVYQQIQQKLQTLHDHQVNQQTQQQQNSQQATLQQLSQQIQQQSLQQQQQQQPGCLLVQQAPEPVQGFNPVAVQQQQPQYSTLPVKLLTVDKIRLGQIFIFEQQPTLLDVYSHPYQPVQQSSFETVQHQQPAYVQAVAVDPATNAQHLLAQQVFFSNSRPRTHFPHSSATTDGSQRPASRLSTAAIRGSLSPTTNPASNQVAPHQFLNQTTIDQASVT